MRERGRTNSIGKWLMLPMIVCMPDRHSMAARMPHMSHTMAMEGGVVPFDGTALNGQNGSIESRLHVRAGQAHNKRTDTMEVDPTEQGDGMGSTADWEPCDPS